MKLVIIFNIFLIFIDIVKKIIVKEMDNLCEISLYLF